MNYNFSSVCSARRTLEHLKCSIYRTIFLYFSARLVLVNVGAGSRRSSAESNLPAWSPLKDVIPISFLCRIIAHVET